ncbi:MAG: universal stress protein [Cyanobacteria bacterium P01_D01_bin.123]
MFRKILVALDRSDMAERVLEEAIALARATNGALMLVHVLSDDDEGAPPPMAVAPGLDYYWNNQEFYDNYRRQWTDYVETCVEQLQWQAARARGAGLDAEYTQQSGSPGRAICNLARTWEADLILMGRRGRKGLSELLLGSVSNYVMHHAPCAVLMINPAIAAKSNSEAMAAANNKTGAKRTVAAR